MPLSSPSATTALAPALTPSPSCCPSRLRPQHHRAHDGRSTAPRPRRSSASAQRPLRRAQPVPLRLPPAAVWRGPAWPQSSGSCPSSVRGGNSSSRSPLRRAPPLPPQLPPAAAGCPAAAQLQSSSFVHMSSLAPGTLHRHAAHQGCSSSGASVSNMGTAQRQNLIWI